LYVVVRKDLSFPQKIVQSCHSVFESVLNIPPQPPWVHPVHPNIISCEVRDERQLIKFSEKLDKEGVWYALFQEPDIGDQYTSLATEIVYGDRRFLFKNLQLIKETQNASI